MINYQPTEEEIQKCHDNLAREIARLRELHRLRQLHGENYLPPVDWKALEEEEGADTANERFMAALEEGRRGSVSGRRGE